MDDEELETPPLTKNLPPAIALTDDPGEDEPDPNRLPFIYIPDLSSPTRYARLCFVPAQSAPQSPAPRRVGFFHGTV